MTYWRSDGVFGELCDLAASDRLVILSGAGISSQLPRRGRPGTTLPQWPRLLKDLLGIFGSRLSGPDRSDCEDLLSSANPSGRDLILAASILQQACPAEFDQKFRSAITPEPGSTSPTHEALEKLEARGIVTFNYDDAHESAFEAVHGQRMDADCVLTPWQEAPLSQALSEGLSRRFLLKAHGSIDDSDELVLTQESYRRLIVRTPAYRAFVQNLLTNFSLLFVGFRFSDPDFDLFIDSIANQFGSPLQKHVGIMHENERESEFEVRLRRLYGVQLLFVKDFGDIPKILSDATRRAGPQLSEALRHCLDPLNARRQAGHRFLEGLGPTGRRLASRVLVDWLEDYRLPEHSFEVAEIAYSLGLLDARSNKEKLIELVDQAGHPDVVGRALTVLRPALTLSDLRRLEEWRERFEKQPLTPDPLHRIPVYLDYLLVYVRQKWQYSDKSPPGA